jgi:hypothetical protein
MDPVGGYPMKRRTSKKFVDELAQFIAADLVSATIHVRERRPASR